jgi:hypothetical protein
MASTILSAFFGLELDLQKTFEIGGNRVRPLGEAK